MTLCSVIAGTGSYIPEVIVPNSHFLDREFYDPDGKRIERPTEEIIQKFRDITGIDERRYVRDDQVTSDIAFEAARNCLESSSFDKECLDYIVVAHNFGDVKLGNRRSDLVPSLATRVKHKLGIKSPKTVAYDLPFGCPGWLQGMIHADIYIKSGNAGSVLVVGAETLSRVADPYDRDSLIYSDGAGATLVAARECEREAGILAHAARTDAGEQAYVLWMGKSNNPNYTGNELFLKMKGHDLYEHAIATVPLVLKEALDKAGLSISDLKKLLIHQANAKMDEKVAIRLARLYGIKATKEFLDEIMPMTISWLGNSSVATVPTLLDLTLKGKLSNHRLESDDIVLFGSMGAGTNVNAAVYRMP